MSHHLRAVPHFNVSLEASSVLRVGDREEEGRLATTENSCLNDGILMPFRLCLSGSCFLSMEQFDFKSRIF